VTVGSGIIDVVSGRRIDVAIVGGGVIGSAIAWFLAADPAFDGRIVVIERDPTYRFASSARSASSIRQQFSTPENIRMSQFGFTFLREIERHLAPEGDADASAPEISLIERGYLYLAAAPHIAAMRENHAVQVAAGVDVALLEPRELAGRFPWLSVDGVALGSLGLHGEGWFDGYALMTAFRRAARRLGVVYLASEATGIAVRRGRVERVVLSDGTSLACASLVDAAGPWAADVAALAGVEIPVEARRRTVFAFDLRGDLPGCPLVIDTSGAWFRPDGGAFIGAIAPDPDDDLPDLPLEVDRSAFEERLWPALATRVPAFDAIRLTSAWAGYYEMNTFDHNAILGAHPEIANLYFANGFSGHGIQQAPAVGRAIAELIAHGRYVSLDLSVFGYERIATGRRVEERNVIG
jgi:glycine/D-amino acid oxidase-like deaminating enzyme